MTENPDPSDRFDSRDDLIVQSIRLYRESVEETRDLFDEAGELIKGSYGWLAGDLEGKDTQETAEAASIADQMHELHQGFLMKVFATVVSNANAQTMQQRQLGRVLLKHIWGKSVLGNELHGAVAWLIETAATLRWSELVRPFAEIPAIRDRMAIVESLAMRQAKLLAEVDGYTDRRDRIAIEEISSVFAEAQGHAPENLASEEDTANARDAIAWLRGEAERLRHGASVTEDVNLPTPTATGGAPLSKKEPSPKPNEAAKEDQRSPEERLADARAKLDRLVGLDAIKDQIQTLTNFLKMEQLRRDEGLPTTRPSLHMAFIGNPGTGKTTVSRIVAEIYGALGILKKGHLVETDRSGLVAEYAGQTGPKTNAKIDEALDGVLFVDEAYTLIDESGQDQYGREAVQTLLKRMEDQRDRLVVILAGYPNEMKTMIQSNPGLSSRVGTTMHFDDYPPMALCQIFELMAGKAKYVLPTESRRRLLRGFTYLYINRDRHFGNGRASRNSFERSVRRLANRIAKAESVDRELLTTLTADDIEVAGIEMSHLTAMAQDEGHIRVVCDECQAPMICSDQKLGTTTPCDACQKPIEIKWGEPVAKIADAEDPSSVAEDSPES